MSAAPARAPGWRFPLHPGRWVRLASSPGAVVVDIAAPSGGRAEVRQTRRGGPEADQVWEGAVPPGGSKRIALVVGAGEALEAQADGRGMSARIVFTRSDRTVR